LVWTIAGAVGCVLAPADRLREFRRVLAEEILWLISYDTERAVDSDADLRAVIYEASLATANV
jgi:hypothetical protein